MGSRIRFSFLLFVILTQVGQSIGQEQPVLPQQNPAPAGPQPQPSKLFYFL